MRPDCSCSFYPLWSDRISTSRTHRTRRPTSRPPSLSALIINEIPPVAHKTPAKIWPIHSMAPMQRHCFHSPQFSSELASDCCFLIFMLQPTPNGNIISSTRIDKCQNGICFPRKNNNKIQKNKRDTQSVGLIWNEEERWEQGTERDMRFSSFFLRWSLYPFAAFHLSRQRP